MGKKMIHLSGYKYHEDIEITGLRPGEKLFEELLACGENTIPTYHEKIMIAKTEDLHIENTLLLVDTLCDTNKKIDNKNSVRIIKEIVPEYISNNSVYEKLDTTIVSSFF
jgi:FlaA1/EpsC-like NDP-sugar epimerase